MLLRRCLVDARSMLLLKVEQVFLPLGRSGRIVMQIRDADTRCRHAMRGEEREGAKGQGSIFMFKFSCLAIKYEFYFTKSPLSFNVLPQNLTQYPFLGPQQDHNPGFP